MCNSRKSAVPKTPLKLRICTQLSYVSSWGSVSCAFPTFWSTPLLAAGHWLNRANSPAISTETCSLHNCRTCYLSATVLALEAELGMQLWLQTTVESEEWTTEIKATYLCIPSTEPILGTDSSDIPNIQHQQSSQIPPYSYLNPQLTNFMFVKEQGKNQINCNLYKVGNPRMQTADPAWG